jgi:hypothetical protein
MWIKTSSSHIRTSNTPRFRLLRLLLGIEIKKSYKVTAQGVQDNPETSTDGQVQVQEKRLLNALWGSLLLLVFSKSKRQKLLLSR